MNMNITKENIDELNAVLKVKVGPADYQAQVEKALKDYQKRVQMPGFRPGKVPAGMVRKMYGKSILADEINKLLNNSVNNYIRENNLDILGSPLPNTALEQNIDWDNQQEFEFAYDLGLSPNFNVEISSKEKFKYPVVKIDDALINKYIDDIAKRYGSIAQADVCEEHDFLSGDFNELAADGTILPGGIFKTSSVFLDRVSDAETKKQLIGLKKDDKVVVDVNKITDNATDRAAMLGIDAAQAANVTSKFQFTVKTITRLKPSEINQDLFEKIYGKDKVTTEEQFRAKIKEELNNNFANDSDRKLYNTVVEHLMQKVNFSLPNDFLKRWLLAVNEKPITEEQLNAEYGNYAEGLKWQLIENKIIKENNITVTSDEAKNYVKELLAEQYVRYNQAINPEDLDKSAAKILTDEKEGKRIFEQLYGKKVMELFKTKFTLEPTEIPYDDFYKK